MTDLPSLPPLKFSDVNVPAGEIDFETCKTFGAYIFPRDRRDELEKAVAAQEQRLVAVLGNDLRRRDGLPSASNAVQREAIKALAPDLKTYQMYTGLRKVPALAELLTKEMLADAYDRVAIFAMHVDVIDQLDFALKQFKPVKIFDGSKNEPGDRYNAWIRLADRFKNRASCRVALIHIPAADTRIDLTHIKQLVFAQCSWRNYSMNAQAVLRCHKSGQQRSVNVRFIGLANTLEQEVSRVLRNETARIIEQATD